MGGSSLHTETLLSPSLQLAYSPRLSRTPVRQTRLRRDRAAFSRARSTPARWTPASSGQPAEQPSRVPSVRASGRRARVAPPLRFCTPTYTHTYRQILCDKERPSALCPYTRAGTLTHTHTRERERSAVADRGGFNRRRGDTQCRERESRAV